ncbi:MAG: hypothetical protein NZ954_00975 [Thermofilaceae archaeon]|nr:hypothetical protein [Thermofilaceae archaeon]MCX8180245.1 hypothetical protein [Thermofilaceae archaeon]MDW8004035.1 hypothetical protein [Thermofilaceae archaeon]
MDSATALSIARRIVKGQPPAEYDELYAALLELKVSFSKPESWFLKTTARAIIGVKQVGEKHWIVPGLQGDYYGLYNVWLVRGGKYRCDCHNRLFGSSREKSVCTHVASVILSRRWVELKRSLYQFQGR